MSRAWAAGAWRLLVLLALLLPATAHAQTRAWLDRSEISDGESVVLTIETDQPASAIDTSPLRAAFDIAGQSQRSSYAWTNGHGSRKTQVAIGLRPRAPGVLTIPSLRVGTSQTAPLRLLVKPPPAQPASARSDVFVETLIDDANPFVQQSVGVTVRLSYAIPLLSGQLDQDPPAHASLQQVGEDQRSVREIGGRRYNVVERHFLLIPEHSGTLSLPGARFNGLRGSASADAFFDDDQHPISAASAPIQLQVRSIPPNAPQPWLPLRSLGLRYLRVPTHARVGEAVTVEIGMTAEGASDAQMPPLQLPAVPGVQVFADPAQTDTQLVDGHLRASVRRSFSLVPQQPGTLAMPGPSVVWWDALAGVARTSQLPALAIDVAPGLGQASPAVTATTPPSPSLQAQVPAAAVATGMHGRADMVWWIAGALVLLLVPALATLLWRRRASVLAVGGSKRMELPPPESLTAALAGGDLARIAHALVQQAGVLIGDLDAVQARLQESTQRDAVALLQASRWGGGDAQVALRALRAAFAGGAHWRRTATPKSEVLPPLYPD